MHNESRRPIRCEETKQLVELGEAIQAHRVLAELTQAELARRSQLSRAQLCMIEHGQRRTRRSTLQRIAAGLGQPELLDVLVALVSTSLAEESDYCERIDRRRARRWHQVTD